MISTRIRIAVVSAATLCLGAAARGDWDVWEARKWAQPPDLEPSSSMAVAATTPLVLASDFLCTNTERLVSIHLWGAWRFDQVPGSPTNVTFKMAIYDDIPAPPGSYSRPGALLWTNVFLPGSFTVRRYVSRTQEAWLNPQTGELLARGDTNCWQYNFPVDPKLAFLQEGTPARPRIYWLAVQAEVALGMQQFGWKKALEQSYDDAVWSVSPGVWQELRDPRSEASIDLAFAIVGEYAPPPEEFDFGDAPDRPYPTLLANNGARHVCGGPWLGNDDDGALDAPDPEADGQPDPQALGDDSDGHDDEDGAWFPTLIHGVATNYTLIVNGGGGIVEVWLDLDGDGAWAAGELIFSGPLGDGVHSMAILIPTSSFVGSTFARCRISTAGTGSPEGLAPDGEVEDHNVYLADGYVGWCNLQWPPSTTAAVNTATENIYGRVWVAGVTDQPGQGPGIKAQCGYGPDGTDPAISPAWVWTDAVYNTDYGNDDEYMAQLVVPAPGRYDYAYRYSRNGIQWSYGDLPPGSANGYQIADAGDLVVPPAEQCPKWAQEPDCEIGLNIPSWLVGAGVGGAVQVVADDWQCDGRPVTAVEWWGSYLGWQNKTKEPVPPPAAVRPVGFELSWHADIPALKQEWSRPGEPLTNVFLTLAPYGDPGQPGLVVETHYCVSDLSGLKPGSFGFEHEYRYRVELPEPWMEKDGQVYWLNVRAVYPSEVPPFFAWGWKTAAPEWNWNDDAVITKSEPPDWVELRYPPLVSPWGGITNHPYHGQSVNMAFRLYTDICPRRGKKWRQPPDMTNGVNMQSYFTEAEPGRWFLRADDFVSDGRRITDIHWWGSYIGWRTRQPGPVPAPLPPVAPLGFGLSWHADIPAGAGGLPYSQPAYPPLRQVFVPNSKCHEVYYGTVTQEWNGAQLEHEYQYYADLLDPELEAGPWEEEEGVTYWLDIRAVFGPGWQPGHEHDGWGWKTTVPEAHWQDVSVVASNADVGPMWTPGRYPAGHPYAGLPMDLAFELTTDQAGQGRIRFTNVTAVTATRERMISVGDSGAGIQYLEHRTNLRAGAWVAVGTNAAPFPPPAPNTWLRDVTAITNEFFRIRQK